MTLAYISACFFELLIVQSVYYFKTKRICICAILTMHSDTVKIKSNQTNDLIERTIHSLDVREMKRHIINNKEVQKV